MKESFQTSHIKLLTTKDSQRGKGIKNLSAGFLMRTQKSLYAKGNSKLDYIKISIISSKDVIKRVKMQAAYQEKIIATQKPNKQLISDFFLKKLIEIVKK